MSSITSTFSSGIRMPSVRSFTEMRLRVTPVDAGGSFTGQMQRFLSPAVLDRTRDFDNHCDALNAIVEKCYGRVAASLGISDQVEHARRRLATEISSGSISSAVLPKRTLGLS